MVVNDPIADMLTRIRNAHGALHRETAMPVSKMKEALAGILQEEGYIVGYATKEKSLGISLKYVGGKSVIAGLKRVSKPGRRVYVGVDGIPKVQNGLGICILSTPQGVLAGETAKARGVGGELLCEIW